LLRRACFHTASQKAVPKKLKDKKCIELFNRYASSLKQALYMNDVVWLVFFYLFEAKVYAKTPTHSAYEICKSLNAIHQANPPLHGPRHLTDKSVNEALEWLAMRDFVVKKEAKNNRKRHKPSGRPPKYFYEIESVATVIAKVKEQFQKRMEQAIDVLQPLQDMEEAAV
jgi:hypothetical protein